MTMMTGKTMKGRHASIMREGLCKGSFMYAIIRNKKKSNVYDNEGSEKPQWG
jgi:hypothetical protein